MQSTLSGKPRFSSGIALLTLFCWGMAAWNDGICGGILLTNTIERPLRYTPVGTDFVVTNGSEFFNRPLYGGSSPFRVDAGDRPEFSLYLPGRGGNLRLGLKSSGRVKWFHDAQQIIARYRPGSMVYEVRDPALEDGRIDLSVLACRSEEGMILRAELSGKPEAELVFAFGGVNGQRGRRDGDIGCEPEPVSQFFQLRPDQCLSNQVNVITNAFTVAGKPGVMAGTITAVAELSVADAEFWNNPSLPASGAGKETKRPIVTGSFKLRPGRPEYLALQRLAGNTNPTELLDVYREVSGNSTEVQDSKKNQVWRVAELPGLFEQEDRQREQLARKVVVQTPDPFVNAAVAALNVAADAVWDDRVDAYLHGGVAWRMRLLGWRVSYAGDDLGWHERTAKHFAGFARQQNTNPIPAEITAPEASANLSRNETALHSNGDLTKSHYDMNLVGVDAFFRHLMWTGDLDYARAMWPTIERHLAWERRLFRREFGTDRLPLYEAYCCIWASDDLAYNGGGATHSSAYNMFHNRMAARVAILLGKDPGIYEREAELIHRGMEENLWLADRGWYAEWKDLLGLQKVHPNAAAWTFYHTVDSEVPTPMEAWEMTRYMDTQIARFPLRGAAVPAGNYTMATTRWMPYTWSLNNVVMAETMHAALGYWQANRPEGAFPLFKGALLDSMYLGLCPGNVGMCTWFDMARGESQRDFGDGIGATSRALVEGLFGVKPDLLAGEVYIRPGFPPEWKDARIVHPDFEFNFFRQGAQETYELKGKFSKQLELKLSAPALLDRVGEVTVNGRPAVWRCEEGCVGQQRILIETAPAETQSITIKWRGERLAEVLPEITADAGERITLQTSARVMALADPQQALKESEHKEKTISGRVVGTAGHRTFFAQLSQGDLIWWQPILFEIRSAEKATVPVDWNKAITTPVEPVDLKAAFNDKVTQLFKNEYRSPRSPFCSLATPKQGFGSWCHPKDQFEVDDSGLRRAADQGADTIFMPNGVPFATPGSNGGKNIVFVSQWDNYPPEISVPLRGKSSHAFLLMAGSTSAMQSRFDNGEVVFTYSDGDTTRLALNNPVNWWPIDQDYYIDGFAFARPEPLPPRLDLKTGTIRVLNMQNFIGTGTIVPGGAATILELPLNPDKQLKSITIRAFANEVVIGLMGLTLAR